MEIEYILLGLVALETVVCLVLVISHSKNSDNSNEQLKKEMELFKSQINSNLNAQLLSLNESTNNKLGNIQKDVNEKLLESIKSNSLAYAEVLKEMKELNANQVMLQSLGENITSLNNVLVDKKNRGTFGEIELYSLLKTCYGDDEHFYSKQYHLENGSIADAVLFSSEPQAIIPIDSKFPLENYNRIYDPNISKEEQNKAVKQFKADCMKHIHDIHDKYVVSSQTSDFAYMFIPAEAVFSEIYAHHEDVIQESYRLKVYLVSPTTLMAYITAIKAINLGFKRNEKAELILNQLQLLSNEFTRFTDRWEAISNDIRKTNKDINDFEITVGKINNKFDSINKVEL